MGKGLERKATEGLTKACPVQEEIHRLKGDLKNLQIMKDAEGTSFYCWLSDGKARMNLASLLELLNMWMCSFPEENGDIRTNP